jgi:hypothetical protein
LAESPDAQRILEAAILGVVDEVFPITTTDVESAKSIVLGTTRLSARDALHAAGDGPRSASLGS